MGSWFSSESSTGTAGSTGSTGTAGSPDTSDPFGAPKCESNSNPCYPGQKPVNFGGAGPCIWEGEPDCDRNTNQGVPCCDVESDRIVKEGGSCTEGADLQVVFGFSGRAGQA